LFKGKARSFWSIVAAVGLTALVGACGSSSGGSGSSSGPSASAAGSPITVGLICSCSGAFGSSVLLQVDVYKAAVNYINSTGGVDGHKIKIIEEDDAANPATSTTDVNTLISDKVDAIDDWSFLDSAWAATIAKSGIPVVGGNISDATFNTFPDFYPQGQTLDSVTEATVLAAKGAGAKSLGIIYCSEAPTCLQSAGEDKTAAGGAGLSVGYEAQASSTEPNYTAQCVAAQQAKAQGIILLYAPATAGTIASNCATQGYNPIYAMEGGAINFHFSESATGLKKDLVGPFTDLPSISTNPEIQEMNSALSKEYPGIEDEAAWTEEAPSAWAAALLLAAAAKDGGLTSGGTASAAEITKGLESMNGETLGGIAPPLTFAAGKPHSIDCWFTAEVKNGTAQMTNGGNTTCSSTVSKA
jgi:branched-chain amino acid transport system substrate-binding protein